MLSLALRGVECLLVADRWELVLRSPHPTRISKRLNIMRNFIRHPIRDMLPFTSSVADDLFHAMHAMR